MTYPPPGGYGPQPGHEQTGYPPPQGYVPPPGHGPPQGYGPPPGHGPPQGYGPPQAYGPPPYGGPPAPPPAIPPVPVIATAVIMAVMAAYSLISSVITLLSLITRVTSRDSGSGSDMTLFAITIMTIAMAIFVGVLAWAITQGRNWARVTIWVISGFATFSIALSLLVNLNSRGAISLLLSFAQLAAYLAVIILLAVPPSQQWFQAHSRARAHRRP